MNILEVCSQNVIKQYESDMNAAAAAKKKKKKKKMQMAHSQLPRRCHISSSDNNQDVPGRR